MGDTNFLQLATKVKINNSSCTFLLHMLVGKKQTLFSAP